MVPAIITAGLLQGLGGLITRQAGKAGVAQAEKEYEKNPYLENVGISDIYNRSLQRASATGLDTVEGRLGQQQVARNLLTTLKNTQGRGRNVEGILQSANTGTTNLLKNISAGRRADLGMLQQAAGMKAADQRLAYKYNVLDRIGRRYGLSAQQMAEGGAMASSGLRNIISGLSALNQTSTGKTGKNTYSGFGDYSGYGSDSNMG